MNKHTLSLEKKIFWGITKTSSMEDQAYPLDWEIAA